MICSLSIREKEILVISEKKKKKGEPKTEVHLSRVRKKQLRPSTKHECYT